MPPAGVRKLISELGLRYRPSERADLEAHAARLALLANDLADIPPRYLEMAINDWVRRSPFLPKASDLAEMAQAYAGRPGVTDGLNPIEKRRAMLAGMNATNKCKGAVWDLDSSGDFYLRDL